MSTTSPHPSRETTGTATRPRSDDAHSAGRVDPTPTGHTAVVSRAGARWLAVTRIALGVTFLWAFLDKTFGLGYSTGSARSWLSGGSPTKGFLSHVEVGPLTDLFHALAGNVVVDWVFMLGLLGIGVALITGVGLWIAAASGAVMMMMMWAAEWPPAQLTTAGEPSGSTNPLVDYHLLYALMLITLAVLRAGHTWGLADRWGASALGRRFPWAR